MAPARHWMGVPALGDAGEHFERRRVSVAPVLLRLYGCVPPGVCVRRQRVGAEAVPEVM